MAMGTWVVENLPCGPLLFFGMEKLNDLLDQVDGSGEDLATIFLCSPNVREYSDADSGDDDGSGTYHYHCQPQPQPAASR